jgi:hypothetical protein
MNTIHQHPVLNSITEAAMTGEISGKRPCFKKCMPVLIRKSGFRFPPWVRPSGKMYGAGSAEFYLAKSEINTAIVAEIEELINPTRSTTAESYLAPSGNVSFLSMKPKALTLFRQDDLNQSGTRLCRTRCFCGRFDLPLYD